MAKDHNVEMPFLDHLEELRGRLFWIVGALFAGVIVAFVIVTKFGVLAMLQRPIEQYLSGGQLVVMNPTDPLRVLMMASFSLGMIFALPVIIYHIWAFLSPGLYEHERKVMIPVLLGATLLFLLGVALSFFVVLPLSLGFLLGIGAQQGFQPMITVSGYFGFAMGMSLAFGIMFEMPIVILALTALGIVTPSMLVQFRRYALVIILVICAVITPPDPLSLLLMAGPVYLLYEFSVVVSRVIFRRSENKIAGASKAGVAA